MSKPVRYRDGTMIMPGSDAMELYLHPPKARIVPNAPADLATHMAELDKTWRKMEGRKPVSELTYHEQMLEGRIPWDPIYIRDLGDAHKFTDYVKVMSNLPTPPGLFNKCAGLAK